MTGLVAQAISTLSSLQQVVSSDWGWVLGFAWVSWQLYCPLPGHTTKLQEFHNDLVSRLERIEVTQIAIAEEVDDVSEEQVAAIHDRNNLRTSDLKREGAD